jgi:mgtE-like transporter
MAFRRHPRRLWESWRAERRTLRQGLVALVLSTLAGFVAGLTLAHLTGRLERLPGLIVLIPAAVGMRGTIFGAIGARLGTATAAGLFEPTLRRDGLLYRNVEVAVLTTFTSSLWLAVLAKLADAAFGQPSISIWSLVTISVVGGALGSAVILLVTVGLSVLSFRRGWDLDSVSTPMVTALGDMATLPTLFLASLLLDSRVVDGVASALCVGAALFCVYRSYASEVPGVRRIALEMSPMILFTPVLDVLAGGLLQSHQTRLLALPALLLMIPPLVSQAGALGGILSSRIASKLQVGVIRPSGWPEAPALLDASLVVVLGLAVFTLIGVVAFGLAVATHLAHPGAGRMIGGTLLAGTMTLPITLGVSYEVAILTSRFGLDPDNAGVPIITSVMDLAGIAAFLVAMTILGVTGS